MRRALAGAFVPLMVLAACGGAERSSQRASRDAPAASASEAAPPAVPEPAPSPFGVNFGFETSDLDEINALIDEIDALGTQWVRVGFDDIDHGGVPDFAFLDLVVDRFRAGGIGVVGLLGGAERACAVDQPAGGFFNCPPAPDLEDEYAGYVEEVVGHFAGRVTYWESWNEPDNADYWVTGPDPADYARVLRLQHPAVERANPDARLLFAATGPTNLSWTVQALDALGAERPYHAVALHSYRYAGGPSDETPFRLADGHEELLDMKSELLASARVFAEHEEAIGNGVEPPDVWVTEVGWGAMSEDGGEQAGALGLFSYADQERFLRELVELLDDPELAFVKTTMWFNAVDLTTFPDDQSFYGYYGLLRTDLSPKPAAVAFRELASEGG